MISRIFTRRDVALGMAVFGSGFSFAQRQSAGGGGVSHNSESIHQEVVLPADRKRVYEALLDAKQFTLVTTFSRITNAAPAKISRDVGGAFSCFDGRIIGRHVELVPGERIVQAWRVVNWDPGDYSIARFEFKEQAQDTRLILDHTGFPIGKAESLAAGWKENYWDPLHKYFSSPLSHEAK